PCFPQSALQALQIAPYDWDEQCVKNRRVRAFVLTNFRADLGRERNRNRWQIAREPLSHSIFVIRIEVSVQQADSDGSDVRAPQFLDEIRKLGLRQRDFRLSPRRHAFNDAKAQLSFDERRGWLRPDGINLPAAMPADFEDILEASSCHKCAARKFPLEDRRSEE